MQCESMGICMQQNESSVCAYFAPSFALSLAVARLCLSFSLFFHMIILLHSLLTSFKLFNHWDTERKSYFMLSYVCRVHVCDLNESSK